MAPGGTNSIPGRDNRYERNSSTNMPYPNNQMGYNNRGDGNNLNRFGRHGGAPIDDEYNRKPQFTPQQLLLKEKVIKNLLRYMKMDNKIFSELFGKYDYSGRGEISILDVQ